MRHVFLLSLVGAVAVSVIGCSAGPAIDRSPTATGLYANQAGTHKSVEIKPGKRHKVVGYPRTGEANAHSILGVINYGDASLRQAAKDGGINEIQHVTVEKQGFAGVFATKKVTVYGN